MKAVRDLVERIRRGDPIHPVLAGILSAAEPICQAGMWLRLHSKRERVDARVISFGNITAGGTGKTPAVIERARHELKKGGRVAVLTRGYRGRSQRKHEVLLLDADEAARRPDDIGDEPALIARRVPGIVIARSADRVAAARMAIRERGCDTLLLDDGYQHVRLERDENIVLIDAANPFGNGHLVPRGILREPLSALNRATSIILTRCDQARDLSAILSTLDRYCPGVSVRKTCHAPTGLWSVRNGESLPVETLCGREIAAVCGIGNPEAFFQTLEGVGARIVRREAFADHELFDPRSLAGGEWVIVTEKDAVRLHDVPDNVYALTVELRDWPLSDV